MKPLKILFLTHQLPFPPSSGGTLKTYKYISHLNKAHQLYLMCLLKEGDLKNELDYLDQNSFEGYYSEELLVPRTPLTILRSYLAFKTINLFRNFSKTFQQKVNEEQLNKDVIIVDHYEMFQYVPSDFKGKVILHTHNAEYLLWQRMAELETKNTIKSALLKLEASRVKAYEKAIFKKADLIYATPSDISIYKNEDIESVNFQTTYHLGNDQLTELENLNFEATELALCFIGTLSWEPNIDGIVWFLQKVWPKIVKHQAKTKLYILGKSPDKRIVNAANNDPRIIFTGFVKDLDKYLKLTRVYIVPLRFGSGMKVKVLEGLYRGVPQVTTTVGAEGLAINNGEEVLIADKATDFAQSCIQLLKDEKLWNRLSQKSRKVAKEKYMWDQLFNEMDQSLSSIF